MSDEHASKDAPAEPQEMAEEHHEHEGPGLLELLLERANAPEEGEEASALPARIDGVLVGRVVTIDGGVARVTFLGAPAAGFEARAMIALEASDKGADVALLFEGADPQKPVIMGRMHAQRLAGVNVSSDGERTEITAEREIVLRCGEASITLTRAGKVLIRGAYVLTRSSGTNRIQGGSVQIN